jgi:hypothetical protein
MKARCDSQAEVDGRLGAGGQGWRNLTGRAGGHPGGICLFARKTPRQAADRLAIDFGEARNFALALSGGQQGEDRGLQMWLQDVHSRLPSKIEGGRLRPAGGYSESAKNGALSLRHATFMVGDFEVTKGGGI